MQIKSNAMVKFIVPAVVVAGLAVGLKSCKGEHHQRIHRVM